MKNGLPGGRKAFLRSLRDLHSPLAPFLMKAAREDAPGPWKTELIIRRQDEFTPLPGRSG